MLPAPLEESASTARSLKARRRLGIGVLGVLLAAGVASCGGTRQDANEPEGNFPVSIVSADFPSKQQLAQNTNLTLAVENSGDQTIPNLAITIFTSLERHHERVHHDHRHDGHRHHDRALAGAAQPSRARSRCARSRRASRFRSGPSGS